MEITAEVVRTLLENSWCAETATGGVWSFDVPSMNQCAVSALVVQDLLGGDLLRCKMTDGDSHYWNLLPDGTEVDLTAEQFGHIEGQPMRAYWVVRTREYVLSFSDTMRRYGILLQQVSAALKTMQEAGWKGKPVGEMTLKELEEFVKAVREEIRERNEHPMFIPETYFEHRKRGLTPEEIHYDMCHIFR